MKSNRALLWQNTSAHLRVREAEAGVLPTERL